MVEQLKKRVISNDNSKIPYADENNSVNTMSLRQPQSLQFAQISNN